ncbi:MAG: carboxypeptidase-like regulatory domain-containing protein, partial [Gemmatimonadetes bacterium]|nr:carboxypeptidase-like regulatory domain-containing protein [Gemmatimonadota bacterium]
MGFLVLLMLCALGAAARPLAAQERGTIQGQVSAAATGRPLAGVSVFVPGTPVATTTNSDGRFLLLNV